MEPEMSKYFLENENIEDSFLTEKCSIIAEDIKNGIITFVDLITLLRNLLINDSPLKKARGITVITKVLEKLPPEFMSTEQIRTILEYYIVNLKCIHEGLSYILDGIITMIRFEIFPGECVSDLLISMFDNVPCQQQQQTDRYKIYTILHILLEKFPAELVSMKLKYVYGVLTIIDGERDPRNLLFMFEWLKIFLSLVKLGHLTEDMFESIACYFPVEYTPPHNSNFPTRYDLAEALLPCLCAIPDFGEYCIPLALEKLKSSREEAILDSLKLLRKGCLVFEIPLYIDSAPEICSELLQKIFSNSKYTPDISTESLQSLSDVIKKISEQDENEQYKDILKNIIDTVKGNLVPDAVNFGLSIEILVNAAVGSKNSTHYVLQEIVPLLTNVFQMSKQDSLKIMVLRSIINLTECYLKYHQDFDNCECFPELAAVPSLCLDLLKIDMGFKKDLYSFLSVLAPCLSTDERSDLYPILKKSILIETEHALEKSVLECLKSLANYYFKEVEEKVLFYDGLNSSEVNRILYAQSVLGYSRKHQDYVLHCFWKCLKTEKYAAFAVKNMVNMLQKTVNNFEISETLVENGVIDILIDLGLTKNAYPDLVRNISEAVKLLIGPQKKESQDEIVFKYLNMLFSYTQLSEINIMLLSGILFNWRGDIPLIQPFLELSCAIAITHEDNRNGEEARRLLANLINKYHDGNELKCHLSTLNKTCLQSLNTGNEQTVLTIAWITKALLMRNHEKCIFWLDWLLGMIEKYPHVKDGLKIIMDNSYDLIPNCYFNIMPLYNQKAFVFITNKICENFKEGKTVYLQVMGSIMEFISVEVLILQFPKIFKIILLSLDKTLDPEILCIILKNINFVVNKQPALIENHLGDFITRIMQLISSEQPMVLKIAVLDTLTLFGEKFTVYKLSPFKNEMLDLLGQYLDDRKRLVRQATRTAISVWYLTDRS